MVLCLLASLAFAGDPAATTPAAAPPAADPAAPPAVVCPPPVDPAAPVDPNAAAIPPECVPAAADTGKKKKGLSKSDNGRMEAEETRE